MFTKDGVEYGDYELEAPDGCEYVDGVLFPIDDNDEGFCFDSSVCAEDYDFLSPKNDGKW
jgi:hypothetical protein